MADQDWRVNGVACEVEGVPEVHTPGESESYRLLFERDLDASGHVERFREVREVLDMAGRYVTYETLQGEVMYRNQASSGDPLVSIQPPGSMATIGGVWGLAEGGADTSPNDASVSGGAALLLDLDVLRLADYDEYADRADAQAALEATGPR